MNNQKRIVNGEQFAEFIGFISSSNIKFEDIIFEHENDVFHSGVVNLYGEKCFVIIPECCYRTAHIIKINKCFSLDELCKLIKDEFEDRITIISATQKKSPKNKPSDIKDKIEDDKYCLFI